MKARFRVTRPALADLDHIRSWLASNASDDIGAAQIERINNAFKILRDFPRLGHGASDLLRQKKVSGSPYLIFYRFDGDTLTILRIRHGREDWRGE